MRPTALLLLCGLGATACVGQGESPVAPPAQQDAGAPSAATPFRVLYGSTVAPLLGVWGPSMNDVFMVGGQNNRAYAVMLREGRYWEVDVGVRAVLWWAFGFSRDDVYAVGERGTIVHFDGQRFSTLATGGEATYWGMWGTPGDLWIVGGSIGMDGPKAVVMRGNGHEFHPVAVPGAPRLNFFKVWGAGRSVFIVGEGGLIYRFRDGAFERMDSGTTDALFTVTGRSERDVYAVGGSANGRLLHFDGERWSAIDDGGVPRVVSGVATAARLDTLFVGFNGYVAREGRGGIEEFAPVTSRALHAVWTDGERVAVAVGGNLLASTPQVRATTGTVLIAGPLPLGDALPWPFQPDAAPGADAGTPDAGAP